MYGMVSPDTAAYHAPHIPIPVNAAFYVTGQSLVVDGG